MMKSILKIIIFTLLISFVFGEFQLMKRTRGYVEAIDYLTIRIEDTNCEQFLRKGGLSDRIRGGYSHHCLPINSRGIDIDDLKFVGRCLNSDKHIVVSIFEIHHKREYKKGGKTQIGFGHSGEDTEFYLRLRSENKPIEFQVKHFNLKNGHVYQVRRPSCIKAQNHCTRSRGKSNNGLMVIDCEREDASNGKLEKHDTIYVEITKRDKKPDTCVDERNGYCCRYVNAEIKGGICKLYDRNRNKYGDNHFNKDNDRDGAFGFDHSNDKEKNVEIGTEFNGEEASDVKTSSEASLKKEESDSNAASSSNKEEPTTQDIKKDNGNPVENNEEEIEFEMEDEDLLKKDEPATTESANQKKETTVTPVSPSNTIPTSKEVAPTQQEVAQKKEENVEEKDEEKRSHIMKRDVILDDEGNENELENDFELWKSTGSSEGKKHNQDEFDDNDLFDEKSSKQQNGKHKSEEEEEEREEEEKKSKSSSAKPKSSNVKSSNAKEENEEEAESEEERNLLEKEDREEREKEKSKLKANNQKNNGNKKEEKKSKSSSSKPKSKSPSKVKSSKPKTSEEEEEEEEREEEEKKSKSSSAKPKSKSSTNAKPSKENTVVLSDEEREAQEERELLQKEESEEEEKENTAKHAQGMDEFTLDQLAEEDPFEEEKEKKNVSVKSGNKVVFMKGSKVEEKSPASPAKVVSTNANPKPVENKQKPQSQQQPPKLKMLPIEFQATKPTNSVQTKPVDVKVTKPVETKQTKPAEVKLTKPVDVKLSEPVEIVIVKPVAAAKQTKLSNIVEKEEEINPEEKETEEVEDLFSEKDESEEQNEHSSKQSSKESPKQTEEEEDAEEARQREIEEKERKEEKEEREREEKEEAMMRETEKEEELQEKMTQEREERADREKAEQGVEDAEEISDLLKSGKSIDQVEKEMKGADSKDHQSFDKKSDSFVLNIDKSDKNINANPVVSSSADKSPSDPLSSSINLDMIQDGNEKVIEDAEAELDDEFAKKK
eukprot:TRINITY_DN237_c0_g1_i3.p1 TRINITY_DN237_c0_g1~~TRINITY_DN237_c0_g1_i3.p1  ORF type:complete len:999 (+),score=451.38 TRINITY_DN237_c0_g1_i3:118-3114(+)